jgi:transcriptional regulator with XRE-family HTH domain
LADNTPAPKGSPRQVFGETLKFYRERAGLSQTDLGTKIRLSESTVRAYEDGRRVPPRPVIEQIENVPAVNTGGALLHLWDQFEEGMNYSVYPGWVADLAEKERAASMIRLFGLAVVPGLLQTEHYMRALMSTRFRITEDEIEERIAERLKRQEILSRDDPPSLLVILDQWAIRRPVGGRDTMVEQVRHLLAAADKLSIRIRLIPESVGAHEGLSGDFGILDFDGGKPGFGFQEGAARGLLLPSREDVDGLNLAWTTLDGEAATWRDSRTTLEESAKLWTSAT